MFTMFNNLVRGGAIDSSDSEDLDDIESMYEGQAESIFSSIDASIGKIDNFLAFDRNFLHGDIVFRAIDPSGQLGRVIDIDVTVDVENAHGVTLKDISSKDLLRIRPFCTGDYVIHGSWLGIIDQVTDLLTVVFDNGAMCEIDNPDPALLSPVPPHLLEDSDNFYHPDQHVKSRVSSVLKNARYLYGKWDKSLCEGVVKHVDVQSVCVNWMVSLEVGCNTHVSRPMRVQSPNCLTLLHPFPHANWQLGDYCMVSSDVKQENHNVQNQHDHAMLAICQEVPGELELDKEQAFVIVRRKVKVDVLWQDATISTGLNSNVLCPVRNVGDHDFLPEDVVLEKISNEAENDSCVHNIGIVKSIDAKERIVKVKWMNSDFNHGVEPLRKICEEIVSAYQLMEHPDYCYRLGEVVCRFQFPCTEELKSHTAPERLNDAVEKDVFRNLHVGEECKESLKSFLSCIGHVSGYNDGSIEVTWANGVVSKVPPHEIIAINREQEMTSVTLFNIENDKDNDIEDPHKFEDHIRNKDVVQDTSNEAALGLENSKCSHSSWKKVGLSVPWATFGFLTKIASSIFCSRLHASLFNKTQSSCSGYLSGDCSVEMGNLITKYGNSCEFLCKPTYEQNRDGAIKKQQIGPGDSSVSVPSVMSEYEEAEYGELPLLVGNRKFSNFDFIKDFSDHHFQSQETNLGRKDGWLKKTSQEWEILEKDLPDDIFVRAYEDRIDLLRAAIAGAAGTPYHDGLFFFDIFIPPDYPQKPPLVHYISGGLQLNPNLYESGHVCLSLLNTWSGTGNEVWNPSSSTILQVLLSLQALVLNAKPYFNEAGYDRQMGKAEGEKNSVTYNENTFLLSCKSMLYLLRKPPKNFETLVDEHFTSHAQPLLSACISYMDGAQVGGLSEDQKIIAGNSISSTGFKLILAKIFPKLVSAFSDKGIDCSVFLTTKN